MALPQPPMGEFMEHTPGWEIDIESQFSFDKLFDRKKTGMQPNETSNNKINPVKEAQDEDEDEDSDDDYYDDDDEYDNKEYNGYITEEEDIVENDKSDSDLELSEEIKEKFQKVDKMLKRKGWVERKDRRNLRDDDKFTVNLGGKGESQPSTTLTTKSKPLTISDLDNHLKNAEETANEYIDGFTLDEEVPNVEWIEDDCSDCDFSDAIDEEEEEIEKQPLTNEPQLTETVFDAIKTNPEKLNKSMTPEEN